jgi:hypothetical protein
MDLSTSLLVACMFSIMAYIIAIQVIWLRKLAPLLLGLSVVLGISAVVACAGSEKQDRLEQSASRCK